MVCNSILYLTSILVLHSFFFFPVWMGVIFWVKEFDHGNSGRFLRKKTWREVKISFPLVSFSLILYFLKLQNIINNFSLIFFTLNFLFNFNGVGCSKPSQSWIHKEIKGFRFMLIPFGSLSSNSSFLCLFSF